MSRQPIPAPLTTPGAAPQISRRDRALVGLYPPSWRRRYRDEFLALLADTPLSPRRTVDVARAAVAAWIMPSRHLSSPSARMTSTISVVAYAWTALTAGALLFGQLTQQPPFRVLDVSHPVAHWLYAAYLVAAHASVAVAVLGNLPLLVSILRTARRQHRRDVQRLMLTPVLSLLTFAAVLVAITKLVHHSATPGVGIGPEWFLVLLAAGISAGAGCVIGPAAAVRRIDTDPCALQLGVLAMALGTATMLIVSISTIAYGFTANGLIPQYGGASTAFLIMYAVAMLLAVSTAACSSTRGLRASHT